MPLLQRSSRLRHALLPLAAATALLLSACAGMAPGRPASWAAPQPLVAPSSFTGVHGLAVDKQGRLLAGSVVGNAIWEVDRNTGAAKILVGGPDGQADDIAIAPNGAMAWTNYLQGAVRIRDNDQQPSRVIASGLPGLNSLAFDPRNGKLYATQVFLGDALWELDPSGAKPPRLIAKAKDMHYEMTDGRKLLDGSAGLYSLAASIVAPLFDAGRRQAVANVFEHRACGGTAFEGQPPVAAKSGNAFGRHRHFTRRQNADALNGLGRTLCLGIEATQGFNIVAKKIDAERRVLAHRKDVDQ
jgi:hypothetical protein